MEKKGVFLCILILMLFSISFALADNDSADLTIGDSEDLNDNAKVTLAYECLEDLVEERTCDKLSLEEKIFTVMAIGDCKSELKDESKSNECWPKSGCNIKSTAQAILALDRAGSSTSDAEDWLISQNQTPSEIIWYLQIDSTEATSCDLTYSGSSHSIYIGEDKRITSGAGSCLGLSDGGWWLRVSPSCYDYEFDISCDKSFTTSLLFQKESSSTIHVLEDTDTSSAEGELTEKINSACFANSGECDYEGSLWATLVLNYLDKDVDAYLPYLAAIEDEHPDILSETFLYLLTGSTDFRTGLLSRQINNQYWDVSGDKFYDTALALYAFPHETPAEKTGSINWLLEEGVQDNDGCWKGNIRNTAFLLYSIWPKGVSTGGGDTSAKCELSGYYCMPAIDCENNLGSILSGYSCDGTAKCCDTPSSLETCEIQGGDICNSDQFCTGVSTDASNIQGLEICCVGGHCEDQQPPSACELAFGNCRISCNDDEKASSESCDDYGYVCCVDDSGATSYAWIWILAILIILVILGIVFKNKLRPFWFRIKSLFKKKPKSPGPRRGPRLPTTSQSQMRRPMPPRRILPPSQRPPIRRPIKKRPSEIDDVLKKLKDMSK